MTKLPEKLTAELNPDTKPQVGPLLDKKLQGTEYLGGPSVRGWSKISSYLICDRLYFLESVRKMRPRKSAPALEIGTLFHACMAAHYWTGGQKTYEPLHAVAEELPELVAEVSRLLQAYFAQYQQEEADTWDIRAVEQEVRGDMTAKLPKKKKPHTAQVSCRFDLVIRKKKPGEPAAPYGPCKDGVYVVDHKVHRAITRDLVEGYGMDGQFLLMAYLWRQQNLSEVFGPLNGFVINIITKTKVPECKRLDVAISPDDVDRYAAMVAAPTVELDLRVKGKTAKDIDEWPMNYSQCKSPRGYGICKFWDFCLSHGAHKELYDIALPMKPPAKEGGTP